MAIDLSTVKPLGSKSVLMQQAMRRQQGRSQNKMGASAHYLADMEQDDLELGPDFEWLKDDQAALKGLVAQMEGSISQLSTHLQQVEQSSERAHQYLDKEQQLLFKQIHTLNQLLQKQVKVFEGLERQISDVHLQQSRAWANVGIGAVAGLMSAITLLVASPLAVVWMQSLMAA
ncbi:MAG: hypothetical protein JXR44_02385 [Thiotrichales bacterium]|nr:hypothetical protein [Thiotrichales bacterium]